MSAPYRIVDAEGERQLEAGDFPLSIGGGDADIRLPGFEGGEPVAYLGLSEGDVFVQPAGDDARVACNGTSVSTSRWISGGDVLGFGAACFRVDTDEDGATRFVVGEVPESGGARGKPVLTPPPRIARDGDAGRGARVQPIAFDPARGFSSPGRRRALRPGTVVAFLFIAALAAAAAFVFTSRSIQVEVEPPPDRMAIVGGLAFELGGRQLLRPGSYVLEAEKAGYRPLEAPLEVSRDTNQVFRFELELLPGLLDVATQVEGAEILVDGELAGTTPLAAPLELSPGDYEVLVRAERHREVIRQVSIEGAGFTESLDLELEPLWAPVEFASKPGGATVRVDGVTVGTTPVTVEVLEGSRAYGIFLAGYKPHRGRVSVTASEPETVPAVTLLPSDGNVMLLSEPDGATVAVNGVFRGEAPLELELEPGRTHQVKVSKSGYAAEIRDVEVRSNESTELRVTLTAQEGRLRLVSFPPDAELFVDGEPRGRANGTVSLQAVPHDIEVRKAGYAPFRGTVTPLPGLAQSLEVTLEPLEKVEAERTPGVLRSSEGHELRRVTPGQFLMGASRREPGRRANEVLREVELTRAFYIADREVTNAQFRRFQAEHASGHIAGRTLDLDDQPVVAVTWEQAAEYCNWLSAREGLAPAYVMKEDRLALSGPAPAGYRLPSEAEWAWTARFPDGKAAVKFPWGDALPVAPASGNYADRSASDVLPGVMADYDDRQAVTAPVASYEPDARGLYDLGGNAAEWVHDYYAIRPAGASKVARDPFGATEGDFHVIRGSSWMHSTVTELRLTYRDYGDQPRPDVGFRIARYGD